MKKIILAVALLVTTITVAQNSLFSNISTTDQYQEYSAYDEDGDGVYEISNRRFLVKFYTEYLPTGEGYKLKVVVDEGKDKDYVLHRSDAVEGYYLCGGYPYETAIKHKYDKDGYVSIGDYVFLIKGISDDGSSFDTVDDVFIKKDAATTKATGGKKKKMSFKEKLKALKYKTSSTNYGPAHKALQSQNLDKLITDYLVAMKAKQDGRSSAEKQHDKNLKAAKGKGAADLKKYNDSIRASPEYKKLKAHQARMKQMDKNDAKSEVTIINKMGRDIYIYEAGIGAKNGTRINVNSSAKFDCSISYTYKFDSNSKGSGTKCYGANSSCGGRFTMK